MDNCEGVAPIKHQRRLYLTESFSQLPDLMHVMVRIMLCFGQLNFYSLHRFSHLAYYVTLGVLTRQWEPVQG